jgi:VCBS repeat-containing protein
LVVPSPGVLGNDSDPDGDSLTASLDDDVDHGELTFNADGSFTYTPDPDFSGQDSFEYFASDGSFSSSGLVTITVTAGGDAPTADDDSYTTGEDTALNIDAPGVLANDDDPDGDDLTADLYTEALGLGESTAHGTIVLNVDGSFTYTPDPDFAGQDSFQYVAIDEDDNESNVATVTITVEPDNDEPVAVADSYTGNEDEALERDAVDGVLANDTDPDGDDLTAELVADVEHGELDLDEDGSFTYVPNEGFTGQDEFTYRASDGELTSNTVTVTITIEADQLPDVQAFVHDVAPDDSVTFTLSSFGADSLTITSSPGFGALLVNGEPVQVPQAISPGQQLVFEAPVYFEESSNLYSFTWTATNEDGTTSPVTEYLSVGNPPVVPDIFTYGSAGQAGPVVVEVNNPGLGDLACAIWSAPNGQVTDVDFFEDQWILTFTPNAGTNGSILVLYVSAGFEPGCDGPWASVTPTGNAFVAVGYTGDNPPAPPDVDVDDDDHTSSGEAVQFTITAEDGNEGVVLPLTIDYEADTEVFPGTLSLVYGARGEWTYEWEPPGYAADVTLTFRISNGFNETFVTVTLTHTPPSTTTTTTTEPPPTTTTTPPTTMPPTTTTTEPEVA